MKMSKATREENASLSAQIAKAHAFSAFLLFGPFDRRKVTIDEGGPAGYAKALAAKAELEAQARADGSTRGAIVYAINKLGSFDVTDELARQAGLI